MAKKILIVDDEPDLLRITTFILKKAGYAILSATNCYEAFDSVKNDTPDLIIMDLRLPIISGDQACKQIKSDSKLKHIPIILFTASINNISEVLKVSGADDYLVKPFDADELLKKVKKIIG